VVYPLDLVHVTTGGTDFLCRETLDGPMIELLIIYLSSGSVVSRGV